MLTHEELIKFFVWCKRYTKLSNFCIDLGISQSEFSKYMNGKKSAITDSVGNDLYTYIKQTLSEVIV